MIDTSGVPLRRWFGTPTAVHTRLLSPEAIARLAGVAYIERHALRDRLTGADWRAEWDQAVARGKAEEAVVVNERASRLAETVAPKIGGRLVRGVIDATQRATDAVVNKLGLAKSAPEMGKAAVGASLTTPLTKTGVLGDVAFSTATNVAETLLRSGTPNELVTGADTATAITYEIASGTAAGVVGTVVGAAATPPVGIAAAVATKLGIDAVRDPVVWRAAELLAGVRAALGRKP